MAVAVRGGSVTGVIFHSDRGSTYTADLFTEACRHHRITQSMGRRGSCLDNAAAESFFSTLEHELLSRNTFATKEEARRRVANWIDSFYNRTVGDGAKLTHLRRADSSRYRVRSAPPLTRTRHHSTCQMLSPITTNCSSSRNDSAKPRRHNGGLHAQGEAHLRFKGSIGVPNPDHPLPEALFADPPPSAAATPDRQVVDRG